MAYSTKVLDHYENPRNVGSLPKDADDVGTGEERCQICRRQVGGDQVERSACRQRLQIAVLRPRVVVVGEGIHAGNDVTFGNESFAQRRADEPGGAGDENSHLASDLLTSRGSAPPPLGPVAPDPTPVQRTAPLPMGARRGG